MSHSYAEAIKQKPKYWKNKPVMKIDENNYSSNQISSDVDLSKFKKEELTQLPAGYTWDKVNICDNHEMMSVCEFLSEHYKRGTDSMYVIKYDADRLRWEMSNTGFFLTICHKNKIVGLIGFTFRTVQIHSDSHIMTEPMYMCCENKYRNKGIAKVLMDETIRQSLTTGINKGVYCDNRIVPKPIVTLRQYSRPLNYKKLRENNFVEICGVDDEIVHNKTKINLKPNKRYIVAENSEENINIVYDLYHKYMKTFSFHMVLTKKDIENYMFNYQYVKTILIMSDDDSIKSPVDFVTYNFYDIDNKENKEGDNIIKVANLLMYSSNEVRPDLIFINILKQISFDKIHIVYMMDMMHSNEFILSNVKNADEDTDDDEEHATYDMNILKTGKKLFINLFNWRCETFKQNMISWLTF